MKDISGPVIGFIGVRKGLYRGYIGITGYVWGLYRDNGKNNGNYHIINPFAETPRQLTSC